MKKFNFNTCFFVGQGYNLYLCNSLNLKAQPFFDRAGLFLFEVLNHVKLGENALRIHLFRCIFYSRIEGLTKTFQRNLYTSFQAFSIKQ